MDWTGSKRRAFRESIQEVYPDRDDLEMFIDEVFGADLAKIENSNNYSKYCFNLIKFSESKGRLDELYHQFREENAENPRITRLQNLIDPLIELEDRTNFSEPFKNDIPEENNFPFSDVSYFYLLISIEQRVDKVLVRHEFQGFLDVSEDDRPAVKYNTEPVLTFDLTHVSKDDRPAVITEQLAEPLAGWIDDWESELEKKGKSEEIILEIFLPVQLLHIKSSQWQFIDEFNNRGCLWQNQAFLCRSLDRVQTAKSRRRLKRVWDRLCQDVKNKKSTQVCETLDCLICEDFTHLPSQNKTVYQIISGLPEDTTTRQNLFQELLKTQAPLILWIDPTHFDPQTNQTALDRLIGFDGLVESGRFAKKIREERSRQPPTPIRDLTVLYDCPHRFPTLGKDNPFQGQS